MTAALSKRSSICSGCSRSSRCLDSEAGKGIIPQMHADAVSRYHWVTSQQFTQFYTIGKLVPGPTTIFAALVGYAATPDRPLIGAAVATLGDVRSVERDHGRI